MMIRDRPIRRPALAQGLAATLLLLGCGDDLAAPSGRELRGTWGSIEARTELIALFAGAELRIPCTTFIIDDPIVLDDTNGFATRARVQGSGAVIGELPVVRLTGSLGGERVTVAVPQTGSAPAATYLLDAGVTVPAGRDAGVPGLTSPVGAGTTGQGFHGKHCESRARGWVACSRSGLSRLR